MQLIQHALMLCLERLELLFRALYCCLGVEKIH